MKITVDTWSPVIVEAATHAIKAEAARMDIAAARAGKSDALMLKAMANGLRDMAAQMERGAA